MANTACRPKNRGRRPRGSRDDLFINLCVLSQMSRFGPFWTHTHSAIHNVIRFPLGAPALPATQIAKVQTLWRSSFVFNEMPCGTENACFAPKSPLCTVMFTIMQVELRIRMFLIWGMYYIQRVRGAVFE